MSPGISIPDSETGANTGAMKPAKSRNEAGMFKTVRQSAARAAAFILLFSGLSSAAGAFEVAPMRMEMAPSGSGANEVITVRNTLVEPLAIEVFVTERIVAEDGTQTFPPNETDFLIFPPQAFIQPGESQAFRVQYIGDPALEASRSYVANVSQVPVKKIDGAGVQLVYRFGAAIYVHPKGSSAALSVQEAVAQDGRVAVKIANQGNRIAFLTNDRVELSTPSGGESYEGASLKEQIENPLVPPLSTRVFVFDAPGVKPGAEVSAVLFPRDD